MSLTAIDLFSGVGGLSLGFEHVGFKIVIANEYDKDIAAAYVANHHGVDMIVGDITTIDLDKVFGNLRGKIDVIVGGPPCQGFSQKGKRMTILDERNFLFKYFCRVVDLVKPRYFVMENVPNLLTAEHGYFREEFTKIFVDMSYNLSMGVLNAADYGVPQNRRRAVIIGKLEGEAPSLPVPNKEKVTIWDAISDLAFLNSGEGAEKQEYRIDAQSSYQKKMRNGSRFLYNHVATKHSAVALKRLQLIPENFGKEVLPKNQLTKSIYSGTWTRMRRDESAVTITTRFDTPASGKFTHPFLNRAITVREAARIQSFPDTFIFQGPKISQMKQVGNAVPPLLAEQIAKVIVDDMEVH